MSEESGSTVDEERGKFGSAGWDALENSDTGGDTSDNDTMNDVNKDEYAPDVPKPDPERDQG